MKKVGQVYWITGLSGSGKTTLARELFLELQKRNIPVILLDGDKVRDALDNVFGYSPEERKKAAYAYARLSALIVNQGINVVVATISMFHDVRKWNATHIQNYIEIYLKSDRVLLEKRDSKGFYAYARDRDTFFMVGHSQKFEEPLSPNFTFVASDTLDISKTVQHILDNNKG